MIGKTAQEGKIVLGVTSRGLGILVLVLMVIGLSVTLIPNASADEDHYTYPPDGLKMLSTVCHTTPRTDIPSSAIPQFCQCWVARLQENIPWASLVQADLASNTNGFTNLSSAEKEILKMILEDGEFCSHRIAK